MHWYDMASPGPGRRLVVAAAGAGVIVLGLAARFLFGGWFGDAAGGLLYAVLVYLLVAFVAPGLRPLVVAVLAGLLCGGVEFLQLTSMPRDLAAVFPPARLVLGTTFVATDLLAYVAGAAIVGVVDDQVQRRRTVPGRASVAGPQ